MRALRVSNPTHRAWRVPLYLALLTPFVALGSAKGCQEACHPFETSSRSFRLVDVQGKPKAGAKLKIRIAAETAAGPRAFCKSRRGRVVQKEKSDREGRFQLRGLAPGKYWITFADKKNGGSFMVYLKEVATNETVDLALDDFNNRCYLVDVERNVTKPPGWPQPVYTKE